MRIIRNYLFKEFIESFISSFAGITFILLLGNLVKVLDLIVRKGVNVIIALKSFLYAVPYLLQYSIPLAALLGILISMGRVGSDNEFVAIKAAGIGMWKILKVFLTFGAVLTLFLIFLHANIIPHSHYMSKKLIKEIGQSNPLGLIEPGVFVDNFDGFVLFTQDMHENLLKNVYIYQTGTESKENNVIFAGEGEFLIESDFLKIKLHDGFIEGPSMKYRIKFDNHFMSLPINSDKDIMSRKIKHLGIKEIISELIFAGIKQPQNYEIRKKELLIELNRKLSLSFASIIFILLGFGVAGSIKVREKSMNLSIIFMAGLGYYLLSLLSSTLVIKGYLPICAIWLPNIIFLLLGIKFSYKTCRS